MNITWPRRKPKPSVVEEEGPLRTQATVLISFGFAIRAIQDGDALLAIFHLSKAVDAISILMERLSGDARIEVEELL